MWVDYTKPSQELVNRLRGTDITVSTLNGSGIQAQYVLIDTAVKAGTLSRFSSVEIVTKLGDGRFLPCEYEFLLAPPTYPHWSTNDKERFAYTPKLYPAVNAGKLSYTLISCGDFYNQVGAIACHIRELH